MHNGETEIPSPPALLPDFTQSLIPQHHSLTSLSPQQYHLPVSLPTSSQYLCPTLHQQHPPSITPPTSSQLHPTVPPQHYPTVTPVTHTPPPPNSAPGSLVCDFAALPPSNTQNHSLKSVTPLNISVTVSPQSPPQHHPKNILYVSPQQRSPTPSTFTTIITPSSLSPITTTIIPTPPPPTLLPLHCHHYHHLPSTTLIIVNSLTTTIAPPYLHVMVL